MNNSEIKPNKKTVDIEKINEPKAPDKVLLGLIFVNFFHLKVFPKTYPPISENIVKIIIHISKIYDETVSFLKCNIERRDKTKSKSKSIIDVFFFENRKYFKIT